MPRVCLVVLLLDLEVGDTQRYALQLLKYLDRDKFAAELWLLRSGSALMPDAFAARIEVVQLSTARRVSPLSLVRLAWRLWRRRPDLLYTLTAVPNIWGRLFAGVLRIPVVSGYRSPHPNQGERWLHYLSHRIIANSSALQEIMVTRFGIDAERIAVIPDAVDVDPETIRRSEAVFLEVAQRGTGWTLTGEGNTPLQVPLWPGPETGGAKETIIERGKFRPDRSVRRVVTPDITIFPSRPDNATGMAVLICPGGAYAGVTIDKEGYEVARWLAAAGIAGIVVKYRLPAPASAGEGLPLPLADFARALHLVRERAAEWRIDPARIGAMGFSAGGHMAAWAACTAPEALAFAVLVYPVISMERGIAHVLSRVRLLGRRPDASLVARYSLEHHPTPRTPPIFLVHARDDDVVDVANSIRFADALETAGVPHEMLLLERGGHGFGVGSRDAATAEWPSQCLAWLRKQQMDTLDPHEARCRLR